MGKSYYGPAPASHVQSRISNLDNLCGSQKGHRVGSQRSTGASSPLERPLGIKQVDNLLYIRMLTDRQRNCQTQGTKKRNSVAQKQAQNEDPFFG